MDTPDRTSRWFDLLWLLAWGIASSAWCLTASSQLDQPDLHEDFRGLTVAQAVPHGALVAGRSCSEQLPHQPAREHLGRPDVADTDATLTSLEGSCGQDLNADGSMPGSTTIEAFASTQLAQMAGNYYLYAGGAGVTIKYAGSAITQGQFGGWTPIGAEQTAGTGGPATRR